MIVEKNKVKIGDLVMFNDEGTYAKWFYGKFGVVEIASEETRSCRVRWLCPVQYFSAYTSISDFGWDSFEVYNEVGS